MFFCLNIIIDNNLWYNISWRRIMVDVVAALIEEDGKILIAKRLTGDINVLGKWEFPGGKVKNNETDKQAIEREIKE